MTIYQKFPWKHLTQNWKKKILFRVFWVGDNFPKILQFYSNFAHAKPEVQQKICFSQTSLITSSPLTAKPRSFRVKMDKCVIQPRYLKSKCSHRGHHILGVTEQSKASTDSRRSPEPALSVTVTAPKKGPHSSFAADADAHLTLPPLLVPLPHPLRTK